MPDGAQSPHNDGRPIRGGRFFVQQCQRRGLFAVTLTLALLTLTFLSRLARIVFALLTLRAALLLLLAPLFPIPFARLTLPVLVLCHLIFLFRSPFAGYH